jgi:methionine-rich copper-binding protein CopC
MKASLIQLSVLLISSCCLSSIARAHAHLDHAEPKVGATVTAAPKEVKIWFSEGVEPDLSKITVKGSDGKSVGKDDTRVDSSDNKLLIVSVADLPPGTYTVAWSVVADDTHKTHGDFEFTVKASP